IEVLKERRQWAEVRSLPWEYKPRQQDPRRGPRAWDWAEDGTLEPREYWLSCPDRPPGDYPDRIRDTNIHALKPEAGGNPSDADYAVHPMQYVSAQAALYFAGQCGCRLPTSAEW